MTIPPSTLPSEEPLPAPDPRLLDAVFASQSMRRALSEAAWAVRVILSADASLIFLHQPETNRLAAAAWHGREAADASLPFESPAAHRRARLIRRKQVKVVKAPKNAPQF